MQINLVVPSESISRKCLEEGTLHHLKSGQNAVQWGASRSSPAFTLDKALPAAMPFCLCMRHQRLVGLVRTTLEFPFPLLLLMYGNHSIPPTLAHKLTHKNLPHKKKKKKKKNPGGQAHFTCKICHF